MQALNAWLLASSPDAAGLLHEAGYRGPSVGCSKRRRVPLLEVTEGLLKSCVYTCVAVGDLTPGCSVQPGIKSRPCLVNRPGIRIEEVHPVNGFHVHLAFFTCSRGKARGHNHAPVRVDFELLHYRPNTARSDKHRSATATRHWA